MKRYVISSMMFLVVVSFLTSSGMTQPPGKEGQGEKGPPKMELGQVFPPQLLQELKLTEAQKKELDAIQKELKAKLEKMLTAEQKKTIENFRPRGPGMGKEGGPGGEKGAKGGKGGEKGGKGGEKGAERPPMAE
jgi:Spy/CpxP family protein refolding chaperone